jgi:extracellular elastinolytic metalloproteinase
MVREFDSRADRLKHDTSARLHELRTRTPPQAAAAAPEVTRVSSLTGSPTAMSFGSTQRSGSPVHDAMALVEQADSATGFAPAEAPEYLPDPNVQTTSSGATVVHLQQHYHGVPIFQMTRSVQFSPDGTDMVGDTAPIQGRRIDTQPKVEVENALLVAARYLAEPDPDGQPARKDHWGQPLPPIKIDLTDYEPHFLAKFELPAEPTVFEKEPFGDFVLANLVLFYEGNDFRLAWNFLITIAGVPGPVSRPGGR